MTGDDALTLRDDNFRLIKALNAARKILVLQRRGIERLAGLLADVMKLKQPTLRWNNADDVLFEVECDRLTHGCSDQGGGEDDER